MDRRAEPVEHTDRVEGESAAPDTPIPPATSGEGLRFRDEAWDDEFCTWLDAGLRTCCG